MTPKYDDKDYTENCIVCGGSFTDGDVSICCDEGQQHIDGVTKHLDGVCTHCCMLHGTINDPGHIAEGCDICRSMETV